jgi:hypothetical protein
VIEDYLAELRRELGAVGIRGRLRRRILVESEDHVRSDPAALERFGSAHEVANVFVAELGARRSRRAAVGAFVALGVAGAVYAATFIGAAFAGNPAPDRYPVLGALAFAAIIVAPQVAFVSGVLALVRSLRRREPVLPTAELTVINRRTGLALLSGLVTMGALALFAFELRAELSSWFVTFTYVATAIASGLLMLAAVPTGGAVLLRPQIAGDAGDIFDDLGLSRFRDDPWRFARRVAFGVGLAVWVAGIVQGDPLDGAVRGFAEALACLGGFTVFGRFLGLRR